MRPPDKQGGGPLDKSRPYSLQTPPPSRSSAMMPRPPRPREQPRPPFRSSSAHRGAECGLATATLAERLRLDPDPVTPGSCDRAFLHLVEAGLVTDHPDDLVTSTLRTVLVATQAGEGR